MSAPARGGAPAWTSRPGGDADRDVLGGVGRLIGQVLGSATGLAAALARLATTAGTGGRPLRRSDLAALRPLVEDVLRRHHGFAAGAGVVLAPRVLADAPRWIEWWWADRGAGIERLTVDLDPASAEFFDYTTTPWYRDPAASGRPSVAGPYVDYICTHRYTFTVSVPVTCADTFLGVAGADILADQVEMLLLPQLATIAPGTVVVGGNGRVIASNTTRLLPGMIGPGPGDGEWSRVGGAGGGVVPWQVLTAAPAQAGHLPRPG